MLAVWDPKLNARRGLCNAIDFGLKPVGYKSLIAGTVIITPKFLNPIGHATTSGAPKDKTEHHHNVTKSDRLVS